VTAESAVLAATLFFRYSGTTYLHFTSIYCSYSASLK